MVVNRLYRILLNRHIHIIRNHITLIKVINILKVWIYYAFNISKGSFAPIYAKIETTDCCNLRCRYCHDEKTKRLNVFLDFNIYKDIIDSYKNYLLEVSLYDQGEPLIDPNIISYIEYAKKNNIGTIISTNLSMELSDDKIDKIINSGTDYIQVAIDGVTQSVYETYRVGGNLERVLFNLERLIKQKNKYNLKRPIIEWQMIDFSHNKGEQEQAKKLAEEMGVDRFYLKSNVYDTYPNINYQRKKRCKLLWSSFAVECNGMLSACLVKDDESLYVGDLNKNSITEIWNSSRYSELRKQSLIKESNFYCNHCNRFDGNKGVKSGNKENYVKQWL